MKLTQVALKKNWFQNTDVTEPMTIEEVELNIKKFKEMLVNLGLIDKEGNADTKLLNIKNLALVDPILFALYAQYYDLASKYEHSDVSSLDVYKKTIDELPINQAFILTLSVTDENLFKEVLNLSISIYGLTFLRIIKYLNSNYEHLIPEESKSTLANIMVQLSDYINNIKLGM